MYVRSLDVHVVGIGVLVNGDGWGVVDCHLGGTCLVSAFVPVGCSSISRPSTAKQPQPCICMPL